MPISPRPGFEKQVSAFIFSSPPPHTRQSTPHINVKTTHENNKSLHSRTPRVPVAFSSSGGQLRTQSEHLDRNRLHWQHLPWSTGTVWHGPAQSRQRIARMGPHSRILLSRQHDSRLQPHPSVGHGCGRLIRHLVHASDAARA